MLKCAQLTSRQAGQYLGIHHQTVKNHWSTIYQKLNLPGKLPKKTKAVMKAIELGIIIQSDLVSEQDALEMIANRDRF